MRNRTLSKSASENPEPGPRSGDQPVTAALTDFNWNSPCVVFLAAAAIALAALAAYWNSFQGVFLFDDHIWISTNRSIRHLWPIWPVLFPAKAGSIGGRPLLSLTLALNYAIAGRDIKGQLGLNPWGYHAVNLSIHILAAWTLFGLIRRTLLLPFFERRFASSATLLALSATLLWALHPLQTQAVTYVIQRTESLVGLFYFLTLYCVLRGATAVVQAWPWYVAALLSSLLGMATKEVMATAPLVVLLYDRTFLTGSFRKALAERWGLYLGLAATWGVIVWLLIATDFHGDTTGFGVKEFTWWSYLRTQPEVLMHYLRLVIWPEGQCIDYNWPPANSVGQIVPAGLAIVALLGLTICSASEAADAGVSGGLVLFDSGPDVELCSPARRGVRASDVSAAGRDRAVGDFRRRGPFAGCFPIRRGKGPNLAGRLS